MTASRAYRFVTVLALSSCIAGCTNGPTAASGRAAAEPLLPVETLGDLGMPEGDIAAVNAAFTPAQLRFMHGHLDRLEAEVNARLKDGDVGAVWIANYFRLQSSLPILRSRLLTDRYFYGWEGPDPNEESSYLLGEQYTHHMAYIAAIEAITGEPVREAVRLTPAESVALRAEAAVRFADRGTPDEMVIHGLCARWLLGILGPEGDGVLTDAEAARWAVRLKAVVNDRWTVARHGDELTVERKAPVKWNVASINRSIMDESKPDPDTMPVGQYRLTLRFGSPMSVADYDRLAADNAETGKRRKALERSVADISHKFDEYVPSNDDERHRLAEYRATADELPYVDLPDLYTTNYAVKLFHSGAEFSAVYGDEDRAECDDVRHAVVRLFGSYNPADARYLSYNGRPEPTTRPAQQ